MAQVFLRRADDVQWLLDTALKGVPLTRPFKSFVLFGNADAPSKLHLYDTDNPRFMDPFREVVFGVEEAGPPLYCTITEKTEQ